MLYFYEQTLNKEDVMKRTTVVLSVVGSSPGAKAFGGGNARVVRTRSLCLSSDCIFRLDLMTMTACR